MEASGAKRPPRQGLVCAIWLVALCWVARVEANIEVYWPNDPSLVTANWSSITSYTLSRMSTLPTKDTLSFSPIAGVLLDYNRTSDPTLLRGAILMGYFPPLPPYKTHERWILDMVSKYEPKGLVLLSSRTLQQVESSNHAVDMSSVSVPVLVVAQDAFVGNTDYLRLLNATRQFPLGLNVSINSITENRWYTFRIGTWPIVATAILAPWSFINIIFAGIAIIWNGTVKNTAFLCLFLEILASLVRLFWATDPYALRYLPGLLLDALLSISYPMTVSSIIILTMFWHQITSKHIREATAVLTTMRVPAVSAVMVLMTFEVANSVSRSIIGDSGHPILIAFVVTLYIVILFITLAYFAFIGSRLRPFLTVRKDHSELQKRVVRDFQIRIVMTMIGLVMAAVSLIVYIASQRSGAGETVYFSLCIIQLSLDIISSTQIWALWKASRIAHNSLRSSAASGVPKRLTFPNSDKDPVESSSVLDFSIETRALADTHQDSYAV